MDEKKGNVFEEDTKKAILTSQFILQTKKSLKNIPLSIKDCHKNRGHPLLNTMILNHILIGTMLQDERGLENDK
jgi:hypothetical protein